MRGDDIPKLYIISVSYDSCLIPHIFRFFFCLCEFVH